VVEGMSKLLDSFEPIYVRTKSPDWVVCRNFAVVTIFRDAGYIDGGIAYGYYLMYMMWYQKKVMFYRLRDNKSLRRDIIAKVYRFTYEYEGVEVNLMQQLELWYGRMRSRRSQKTSPWKKKPVLNFTNKKRELELQKRIVAGLDEDPWVDLANRGL